MSREPSLTERQADQAFADADRAATFASTQKQTPYEQAKAAAFDPVCELIAAGEFLLSTIQTCGHVTIGAQRRWDRATAAATGDQP